MDSADAASMPVAMAYSTGSARSRGDRELVRLAGILDDLVIERQAEQSESDWVGSLRCL